MKELKGLMQKLGYNFSNIQLLENALSHRSIGANNNERLEFLGDAILEFIISTEIYNRHPGVREGELTQMRASIVNGDVISQLAADLNVGPYIRLAKGEQKNKGYQRRSILANTFEALIGAIYLDSDVEQARCCVLQWYGTKIDNLSQITPKKDPKSALQEWLQARKKSLPIYKVSTKGEEHKQTFTVTCHVDGIAFNTQGVGSSRRRAEQMAAEKFLEQLNYEK